MSFRLDSRELAKIGMSNATVAAFQASLDLAENAQAGSPILEGMEASYTTTEKDKLANIEDDATADQTGAEIKTAYESEGNTNAFTDALLSKLNNIESTATRDQTGAEIKASYEAESNTNVFTDTEKTKLAASIKIAGIPASASATGSPGDFACDGTFAYYCHITDTWTRWAVATW